MILNLGSVAAIFEQMRFEALQEDGDVTTDADRHSKEESVVSYGDITGDSDMWSLYATGLPTGIYRRSNIVYDPGSNDSGFNGIRQDECAKLRDAGTYQGRMNTTDELDQICLVNKAGDDMSNILEKSKEIVKKEALERVLDIGSLDTHEDLRVYDSKYYVALGAEDADAEHGLCHGARGVDKRDDLPARRIDIHGGHEKNEDVLCGDTVKVNQMNKVHIDLNGCSEEMDYDLPDVAPVKGEDTTDHANMRVWESFAGGTFGGIVARVVDSLDRHEGNVLDVLKGSVAPSVEQKIKEEMGVESNGNRYSNDKGHTLGGDWNVWRSKGYLEAEIRVDLNGHRMDGDATVASSKEYEVRLKKGARNEMDSIVAVMVEC
eukprot:139399_1